MKDATDARTQVQQWWARWPNANVGIATGIGSWLVVLDVDPRNGGSQSLDQLQERFGELPSTVRVASGGGGTHYYFAYPGDGPVPNRGALGGLPGLDFKGDGGYVVAPPSTHASGGIYLWTPCVGPEPTPLAPCPRWMLDLALQGPSAPVSYPQVEWDGNVPARVGALLEAEPYIASRFHRAFWCLTDRSPSGVDQSLASVLALNGLTGPEIEAALRASRARGGLPDKPRSYYRATVGKALGAHLDVDQTAGWGQES